MTITLIQAVLFAITFMTLGAVITLICVVDAMTDREKPRLKPNTNLCLNQLGKEKCRREHRPYTDLETGLTFIWHKDIRSYTPLQAKHVGYGPFFNSNTSRWPIELTLPQDEKSPTS